MKCYICGQDVADPVTALDGSMPRHQTSRGCVETLRSRLAESEAQASRLDKDFSHAISEMGLLRNKLAGAREEIARLTRELDEARLISVIDAWQLEKMKKIDTLLGSPAPPCAECGGKGGGLMSYPCTDRACAATPPGHHHATPCPACGGGKGGQNVAE